MFHKQKYYIKKVLLNMRYKIILWLVGKMPVIINCTIYDDVMEYNFGKTRTYKPCICFNNRVKKFDKVVDIEIRRRMLKSGEGVSRKNNSFVLAR